MKNRKIVKNRKNCYGVPVYKIHYQHLKVSTKSTPLTIKITEFEVFKFKFKSEFNSRKSKNEFSEKTPVPDASFLICASPTDLMHPLDSQNPQN